MFENLQDILRRRRENGETNQSMADSCGLSQTHINRLLNGDAKLIDGIHLAAAYKLFPFLFRDTSTLTPPALSDAESRLLAAYRQADASERRMLDTSAEGILARAKRGASSEEVAND